MKVPCRSISEKEDVLNNARIIADALKLYSKYEKIIDLIETCNMNIDSVYNLLYINAAEIELNNENHMEVLCKLIKEGKVKGYEK